MAEERSRTRLRPASPSRRASRVLATRGIGGGVEGSEANLQESGDARRAASGDADGGEAGEVWRLPALVRFGRELLARAPGT